MEAIFSSPILNAVFFFIASTVVVYLILQYDKQQRKKINTILTQTREVQPLFMTKAINNKIRAIKPELNTPNHREIARQLDELVYAYDHGQISLPDYCHRLNRLLSEVA